MARNKARGTVPFLSSLQAQLGCQLCIWVGYISPGVASPWIFTGGACGLGQTSCQPCCTGQGELPPRSLPYIHGILPSGALAQEVAVVGLPHRPPDNGISWADPCLRGSCTELGSPGPRGGQVDMYLVSGLGPKAPPKTLVGDAAAWDAQARRRTQREEEALDPTSAAAQLRQLHDPLPPVLPSPAR